jgi:hypothetical protein
MTTVEPSLRAEFEQVLSESFGWVDHGETDRLPTVGEEGFVFDRPGHDLDLALFEPMLAARVTAPHATRHQWSNLRVTDVDGDAVDIAVVACVSRGEEEAVPRQQSVADFTDRRTRTPDGWRLVARTSMPVFDSPQV